MATDAAGRALHCVVEQSVPIQGQDYGILSPVDIPAWLFRWPHDAAAEPRLIEDPHQYPQVLDELDMALRDMGLFLVRSAGVLTVGGDPGNLAGGGRPDHRGEPPVPMGHVLNQDDDTDPADPMDNGDGPGWDGVTEEENPDGYFALASVCCEGVDFDLYGSLEPCFLVARLGEGHGELLPPDVLARLQPLLEDALAQDGEEANP